MIVELIDRLVSESRAEWTGKEKEKCFIYWNSPEEWASLIYTWVYRPFAIMSLQLQANTLDF